MFPPRVISKTAFNIGKLSVSVCEQQWTAPHAYDLLVGSAWKVLQARSQHPMWDGTYYRVLNPAELETGLGKESVRLGTIRYRYIATYPALREHHADWPPTPFTTYRPSRSFEQQTDITCLADDPGTARST